jgi:hypothetical protein
VPAGAGRRLGGRGGRRGRLRLAKLALRDPVVLDGIDTVLKREELRRPVHLLHSTKEGEPEPKRENDQVEPLGQGVAIEGDALLGGRHVGATGWTAEASSPGPVSWAALLDVGGRPPMASDGLEPTLHDHPL